MVMRVQRVGEEYRIVLSPEALEALHLTDGAEVEIRRVGPEQAQPATIRYLSVEEALDAYRETLPQHREAYRALAK